jgi:hypothetical protein
VPASPSGLRYNKAEKESLMEKQCSQCNGMFPEEELLEREDTTALVCENCSGLLGNEDLSCRYDEQG